MLAELQNLYGRYGQALRREDLEAVLDCFTEDARFSLEGVGTFVGRDAIGRLVATMAPDRPRHHVSDVWIEQAGGNRARGLANLVLLDRRTGATLAVGHYEDVVVRDERGWRWAERVVAFDWRSTAYQGNPPSTRSSDPVV